jgi:hypothetical protein
MDSYSNTQNLTDFYLQKIRERPEHYLRPQERLEIYKSLGNFTKQQDIFDFRKTSNAEFVKLNLNTADKTLAILAIITAKKVLPFYSEAEIGPYIINEPNYSNSPFEMLEKAENLLEGSFNAATAWSDLIDTFYYGLISIEDSLNEKVSCAVFAAFSAFTITIRGFDCLRGSANQKLIIYDDFGFENLEPSAHQNRFDTVSLAQDDLIDSIDFSKDDFAAFAERAYTSFDENAPGLWAKKYPPYIKQYKPLSIDTQKRLEFWEWWLTEAIPQAWELAHKSE